MKRSWKTTAGGLSAVCAAAGTLFAIFADDVADLRQLPLIFSALGGIGAGVALLFARDNNVSSEDVGIEPEVRRAIPVNHPDHRGGNPAK